MSLPSPDPGPRILPKVFADVPSAAELTLAQKEAASARASRNTMSLLVVLLLGMLIAAGGAVVYFEGQARELPAQIEDLQKQNTSLQANVSNTQQALDDALANAEKQFRQYAAIDALRAENEERRVAIRKLLEEEKKGAEGAFRPALGTEQSTSAFDVDAWLQLRDGAEKRLEDQSKELDEIQKKVSEWNPPPRPGRDPRY